MVQKMMITLEIDDSALDAAQAKADKLIATLHEAEALAGALENTVAIDCGDFADRLAAVKALAKEKPPDPDDGDKLDPKVWLRGTVKYMHDSALAQAKKPPEGGNECGCMAERLDIAKAIAQAMFKPPD